jgi:hypothetical protein
MAQLPLDQGINRFKANEERIDRFANEATGYTASGGQTVESIREFLARIEQTIAAYGTLIGFPTLAALNAALAYPAGTMAYVTNDATTANNGYYIKSGASGSGAWTRSNYDPVNTLSAEVDVIQASLQTLGLDRLANFFPNGSLTPDPTTGVVWAPGEVTVNGTYVGFEAVSQADLASYGLTRAMKLTRVVTNRHAIMELPLGIGGQWLIMSWITYVPSGAAAAHGGNNAYIGKNGALGDGRNGVTDVTQGEIIVNDNVRIHWLKCKLFSTYDSAQAWVGSTGMGSTTEDVYLTGFNTTWTTNAAVGVLSTSYNNFSPSALQNDIRNLQLDVGTLFTQKKDNEIPQATLWVNAVTDKYATRNTVPSKHKGDAVSTVVTYPFQQTAYDVLGEPNVMRAASSVAGRYSPTLVTLVTPEDLALIGVVPNDTTPPRVSIRGGRVDSGANQSFSQQQIFFELQYSDAPLNVSYSSAENVLFNGVASTAAYLGQGDTTWNHSVESKSGTDYLLIAHKGIPVPATYNGKPFRGIKIMVLAYATDPLAAVPKEVMGFGFAVIAGSTISTVTPYLNKPQDIVGYVGLADIQRLDAEMANKVPGYENLIFNNAVKNRFGPQGAVASSNIAGRGVVTYHRDDDIFEQDGARNVLKSVYSGVATRYYPLLSVMVSPQDLADLGIVPNNTTPPRISIKAAWVKSLVTQHITGSLQIFFSLRYGGTLNSDYNPSRDVMFNTGSGTASYVGQGDASWTHSVAPFSDALKQGWCHNNIPVPANYNGLPFTGIVISLLGYPTVEGDPNPTTLGMTDVAVVAGASVQPNFLYLNSPDDYAKVGNIQKNQLSSELQGQLVFKGEGGDVANTITIQNSDKIVLLGDSYSSSHYTMKDKPYIARLAELSDWRFENFSRSGDDYAEINQRILTNVNDYHPSLAFKQMGGSHALLISFTNDVPYRSRNLDYFFDNVRRIAQTVMGCGVKPILATEFVTGNSREITGLSNIARELGIEFIDIASNDRLMDVTRYNQYWGGGHPAARTNGLFYAPLLPYFNARRPRQGIKVYRKRPTFTIAQDADLLYDDIQQRVPKWKELTVGHHSLVGRLEPYYDRMTDIADAHGGYSYNANISEYLKLQNKEAVAFSDYALVEVILPTTASRASSVYLNLSDSTVEVYCRNSVAAETFDGYTKQQAFVVADFPLVTAGDTYSYSGTTFTITGTATTPEGEKLVLATPRTFDNNLSAGTLTRVSGSGPASVAISSAYVGFAASYYTDLYKPRGVWKSLTNEAGKVTLTGSALQEAMQYDKLVFMIKKSGGFSLSDIYVDWYGTEGKDSQTFENPLPLGGTQVLTSTKFDTVGSWTLEGGTAAQDPADGVLPRDCTKLIKVSSSKKATQSFSFTADSRYTKELDIVVWARRYPAEFIPSSNETTALTQYQTTAPINSNTCDYRGLRIQLDNGSALSAIKATELVGLHWQEVRVRLQLPNVHLAGSSFTLRLDCPDDELELALAEVWVK